MKATWGNTSDVLCNSKKVELILTIEETFFQERIQYISRSFKQHDGVLVSE